MKDIVSNEKNIHLAIQDPTYKKYALAMYDFLIKNNFGVYWNYKYNLKKSLSLASDKKAQYIIIVGELENTNNKYALKNLISGEQKIVDLKNILDHIK